MRSIRRAAVLMSAQEATHLPTHRALGNFKRGTPQGFQPDVAAAADLAMNRTKPASSQQQRRYQRERDEPIHPE